MPSVECLNLQAANHIIWSVKEREVSKEDVSICIYIYIFCYVQHEKRVYALFYSMYNTCSYMYTVYI